ARAAPAETLLRVATPGALTGALPIYLGAKKGVFSKHGLSVEVIATRNEQMNMQALMSDSVQFLTSSSTGLFYLGKQGLDAVGLASWNNSSPYSLASRLKIKDLKELKGRKIASSGAGGRADAYIRLMMTDKASTIAVMAQVLRIDDADSLEYAYKTMRADSRPDLFPTEEAILNVLRTMSYEDPAFGTIPPYKFFDLSLIQELKAE